MVSPQPPPHLSTPPPLTLYSADLFHSLLSAASPSTSTPLHTNTTAPLPASALSIALANPPARATERRLRRARDRYAAHRHDLLVALRLVNRLERDTVAAEYENWIEGEAGRCRVLLERERQGENGGGTGEEVWWRGYCGSCLDEGGVLGGVGVGVDG